MAYYGAEAAVEAMSEFLTDATYGLNAQLATMRSEKGLTTAQLPDISQFEKYYPKGMQSRQFPTWRSFTRATLQSSKQTLG